MRNLLILLLVGFVVSVKAQEANSQREKLIKGLHAVEPTPEGKFNFRAAVNTDQNKKQWSHTPQRFVLSEDDISSINLYQDYMLFHAPMETVNQLTITQDDYSYPFLLNSRMSNYVISPLSSTK